MPRISSYYKSDFTIINIRYGNERVSFNLMQEVRITPDIINDELKGQASKYGFCLMLHKKLLTEFERLKLRKNKIYGILFFKAKEQKGQMGRYFSDDLAKAWVEKHPKYQKACLACIKSKDDADAIYSCIKAFEQRKDLIQSLSSNIRNEK